MVVRQRDHLYNHIDVKTGVTRSREEFRFTGIYNFAHPSDRFPTWNLLRSLAAQSSPPWLVAGDFNEILSNAEKSGGPRKAAAPLVCFRQALVDCALVYMKFSRPRFTWANRFTKERLDRACHTSSWRDRFPNSRVVTLPLSKSDHNPLLVVIRSSRAFYSRAPKRFRFKEMWSQHKDCVSVIKKGCMTPSIGNPMLQVGLKIHSTGRLLSSWEEGVFKQRHVVMKLIQANLDQLMGLPYEPDQWDEQKALQHRFNELLSLNETYWRQRSRVLWLKDGDRNTIFFHRRASNRKSRNSIIGLLDPEDDEIKKALFQMHLSKSPGPDGMSPHFFQRYWSIVHNDVCLVVRTVLETRHLPMESNFTHLVLIPKVKEPKVASDLRPIALCNVVYKITSKVLTNRLKVILPHIISPLQSAFVPGRLISNNTLVAFEINHFMKKLCDQLDGFFSLKLDISKAYDRLELDFLEAILRKLGFCNRWIDIVLCSVKSISYSFIINGEPTGFITPTRGIRQGDPLSPYLFILCAEGLSSLISKSVEQGFPKGLKMSPSAPIIYHLLFADDNFLFGEATEADCTRVLDIYARASGQQINLQKSSVMFSFNVSMETQSHLTSLLEVQCAQDHG
ncbi:uncharacterized protein LOC112184065 [Rosa chinensis]|uniref:uncharacterized protein LOC112184065 n=1 Tax=Rosa chinensis TaxID=74649 RepID=UPI000D0873ED|nr:uncharacterized protein LOC112184065 [Rosa chinensis]